MWVNFDRTAYTREAFAARIAALPPMPWCKGITLHNTAAPTLAQWAESGEKHDQRITNLQAYYEGMGWHAGPHLFISRNFINGFSDLTQPGVHSRCYNKTHLGIEMVGDYNSEPFDSGDGALVRDNTIFALATLYKKLGLDPNGLVFHKECKLDNHDCPGKLVSKDQMIAAVLAAMGSSPTVPIPSPEPAGKVCRNIIATVFGGRADPNNSAYDELPITDEELGGALPFRFTTVPRRDLWVQNVANGLTVIIKVRDVGPIYPHKDRGPADPYWLTDSRPRAETMRIMSRAGIDLTPAAARAIGIDGKGLVNWSFVTPQSTPATPPSTPPKKDIPVSTPVSTSVLAGIPFDAISGGADQYMRFVPMLVNFLPENIRGPLRESLDHVPAAQLAMELEHIAFAQDGVAAANAQADAAEAWAKKRRAGVAGSQPVDVQGRTQ